MTRQLARPVSLIKKDLQPCIRFKQKKSAVDHMS